MSRLCGDRGTGLVGSASGVIAFLALMFLAVQLLMNLYATSIVTSAASEAVHVASGRTVDQGDPSAVQTARWRAERRARELLGTFGDRAEMDWSASDADTVVLRVQANAPRFLIGPLGDHRIDRTARARVERVR